MRGKFVTPKLSHERLLEVIDYHPATGEFFWKVTLCKKNARAGDPAGSKNGRKSTRGYIKIDGEGIRKSTLAWFYVTKKWPDFRITNLNGDKQDFRFENLAQQKGIHGEFDHRKKEERIAYQRILRKVLAPIKGEKYDQMFDRQNGLCAICERPETSMRNGRVKALAVDHDHETGKVRELLCWHCNSGLGKFKDDSKVLRKAAEYLEKHSGHLALSTGPAGSAQTIGQTLAQEERV